MNYFWNYVSSFYYGQVNAFKRPTLDLLKKGKLTDEVIDTLSSVAKDLSAKY